MCLYNSSSCITDQAIARYAEDWQRVWLSLLRGNDQFAIELECWFAFSRGRCQARAEEDQIGRLFVGVGCSEVQIQNHDQVLTPGVSV